MWAGAAIAAGLPLYFVFQRRQASLRSQAP
jgi:hypothetical protein